MSPPVEGPEAEDDLSGAAEHPSDEPEVLDIQDPLEALRPYVKGMRVWLHRGCDHSERAVVTACRPLPTGGWAIDVMPSDGSFDTIVGVDSAGRPFGSTWIEPRE